MKKASHLEKDARPYFLPTFRTLSSHFGIIMPTWAFWFAFVGVVALDVEKQRIFTCHLPSTKNLIVGCKVEIAPSKGN